MLNGSAIQLGAVADVVDQVQGRRECGIALLDGDVARYEWKFEGERDDMGMTVRRVQGEVGEEGWDVDETWPLHLPTPARRHNFPTARQRR